MTPNQFRALIAGQWVMFFLVGAIAASSDGLLPEPLRLWAEQDRARSLTDSEQAIIGVTLAYLVLSLLMSVGLVLFQPWAKRMMIPVYALGVILTMFGRPGVETSVESAFEYLMCIIDGAVLAAVYMSPVREYFEVEPEE